MGKGKVERKHSLHGESSSIGFIEAIQSIYQTLNGISWKRRKNEDISAPNITDING